MKSIRKAAVFALAAVLLFASCYNYGPLPPVIGGGPWVPSEPVVTADEAAKAAAEYIDAIDYDDKLYPLAKNLLTAYVAAAGETVQTEYAEEIAALKTVVNAISGSSIPSEELTSALDTLIAFAGTDMPVTAEILGELENGINEGTAGNLILAIGSIVLPHINDIDTIFDEVSSKIDKVLGEVISKTESVTSDDYTFAVTEHSLDTEKFAEIIKVLIAPTLKSYLGSLGSIVDTVLSLPEEVYAPMSLSMAVTSNTMNPGIFTDESQCQYKGTVNMTVDFSAVYAYDEHISDNDTYVEFDSITVASAGSLDVKKGDDQPVCKLGFDVEIPLTVFADYEEGTGITIENPLNQEITGTMLTVAQVADLDNASGTVTYEGTEVPFGDVYALTAQGQ